MLEALAVAALLHLPTDHRTPQPSRSVVNRFMDSGDPRVWRGVPTWIRSLSLCIRRHESIRAGHYRAHNGHSSAAGAYQMLTPLWRGAARWTPLAKPWAHLSANRAPAYAQDATFIHIIRGGGIHAWRGTGCPGT
jgi:hypothetical protein